MRRLLLLALLMVATPAIAATVPSVLGSDGEIYRVLNGEQRLLLPSAPAATANNQVLVLEIVRVGSPVERQLVPGSENEATENYPALALDQTTNSLFVVWEAQFTLHSTLHLAAFANGDWSDVFELSGDAFSEKFSPQLAATTDRYQKIDDSGAVVAATRTVLHLVWWDEGARGGRALYAALRVEDGQFVPDWQVLALPDLLGLEDGGGATAQSLPASLYLSPQVRSAAGGGSALVAFGEPATGRLGAVEIRPVSGSLVSLADKARVQIIDIGRKVPGDRQSLAEKARVQIIDIGRKVMGHDVAEFLAARCADFLAASDPLETIESVAEKARVQIIDIGAQLSRGPRVTTEKARVQIIDLGHESNPGGSQALAALRVAAELAAPEVPDHNTRLLVSDDGEDLVVAWDLDAAVKYRQTVAEGWSDVRALALNDRLTRDDAYQLLVKRLQR